MEKKTKMIYLEHTTDWWDGRWGGEREKERKRGWMGR